MKLDYNQRIMLGMEMSGKTFESKIISFSVQHDSRCPALKGGKCSCTPDISLNADGKEYTIDEEGVLHP
jgi:hypothetical protein